MLENKVPIRPVTGLDRVDNAAAKPTAVMVVNPLPQVDTTTSRSGANLSGKTGTFNDIQLGYMLDSYIHQAVSRYSEKIVKEDHYLIAPNQAAVKYTQTRFDMMTAATGQYWQEPLIQAIRDYVKFGNAFLIKARYKGGESITGPKVKGISKIQGLNGKGPVGGYYCVSPMSVSPKFDEKNALKGWQVTSAGGVVVFDLDDVIHITYDRQPGGLYGVSWIAPALDDVRNLRSLEEMVQHLIFKSLNPLIHHEVPDTTGTGRGRAEDVQAAAARYNAMPVNGYLITPPGHKINILGVESKALRAEGYIRIMRERVYAGLGVNPTMMGEAGTIGTGVTESFTSIMHDKVRFFQKELADNFTHKIISELLQEGGYNPVFDPRDKVQWVFNEVDLDRRIKLEAHRLLQYHGNAISEPELRSYLNLGPVSDAERASMYLDTVQMPQLKARAASYNQQGQDSAPTGESRTDTGDSSLVKEYLSKYILDSISEGRAITEEDVIAKLDELPTVDSSYKGLVKSAISMMFPYNSATDLPVDAISKLHAVLDTYADY